MTSTRPKPRLSWRKRLLFTGVVCLALTALLELVSYVGICLICQYTVVQLRELRNEPEFTDFGEAAREVVHPYLGWVLNPETSNAERYEGRLYPVNEFGLMDNRNPLQQRSPDKVIVAVAGGSVAWQSTVAGNETLIRELQQQPRFQGKEVVLVRLAMNAYKQPQQLLLVTYLLSLGAEWDILINIDGYNETALHAPENGRHGVFAAYPRAWKARNELLTDPDSLQLMARLSRNRIGRERWTAFCNKLPFQSSCTLNFIWKARDQMYFEALQRDLETSVKSYIFRPGYQVKGPPQKFKSPQETTEYLVKYWQDCSRQLERVCRVNGIEYHQVLPPNQRLKGSKPIGDQEGAIALKWTPYAEGAERAYPLLIAAGAELQQQGIPFHDLSQLFKDHPEPIYIDDCCHYSSAGNALLATTVARIVGQAVPEKK